MGFFDIFDNSTRRARRDSTIRINRAYGYSAEKWFEGLQAIQGSKVTRTGRGSDYAVEEFDSWTGGYGPTTFHEIKTGNSELSPLQKKTQKKKGPKKYKVHRY